MLLAIAPTESEALDIARRGMDGLMRRTHNVHKFDHLVLPRGGMRRGARTRCATSWPTWRTPSSSAPAPPSRSRIASPRILEPGLTDYIVLQIPAGDMTLDEAKRTMDLFCSEVKPQLEEASLAA